MRQNRDEGEDLNLFRFAIEQAADAVFFMNADGGFDYVNDTACRSLGYTREELQELRLWDIDPLYPRERWHENWASYRRDGGIGTQRLESLHRRKDGTVFPIEVLSQHIWLGDRDFHVAFTHDISERKRTEEALRESEERHRTLFETMAQGVVYQDAEGRVVDANPAAERILGLSLAQMTGRTSVDPRWRTIHEDGTPLAGEDHPAMVALRTGAPVSGVPLGVYNPADDGYRWLLVEAVPEIRGGETRPYRVHTTFMDITGRRRAEAELRLSQFCIDKAAIDIFRVASDGRITSANDHACRTLQYSADELLALTVFDVNPTIPRATWETHRTNLWGRGSVTFETVHRRKDGTTFPVEVTTNAFDVAGEAFSFTFARDLTERKRAEAERAALQEQLLQSRKLESIGRLAGGVAHDFNNMLGVILGHAELLLEALAPGDPKREDIEQIERAAMHSRDVTRQLLAFSRKQIIAPRPVALNDHVQSTRRTLARLIGEDIDLRFVRGNALWTVEIDPSQVDQILVNLAVNARDAMVGGGVLTIETGNVRLDGGDRRRDIECQPGDYVLLQVSDTGEGMSEEVRQHIFEPFYTTKNVGEGTGLGLATVYGIVKQNGGFCSVSSEVGRGTTFQIYLPRRGEDHAAPDEPGAEPVAGGAGTVLVVEDDEMVRRMTEQMLLRLGYDVRVAESPSAALSWCERSAEPIALIVADVVMPGMSGPELSERVRRFRPAVPVLFMSGYTTDVIVHHGVLEGHVHFVQKPFSMRTLANAVRDALESN